MMKKILSLLAIVSLTTSVAMADVKKVAVVDVQAVVAKSVQVQNLKKEQDAKRKEMAQFIKKAGEDIKKQTTEAKKQELAKKYDNELNAKREANEKAYKTKLQAIDKNISDTIVQQAKAMGYDLVLTKGVVLYGGDDITGAVSKVVK